MVIPFLAVGLYLLLIVIQSEGNYRGTVGEDKSLHEFNFRTLFSPIWHLHRWIYVIYDIINLNSWRIVLEWIGNTRLVIGMALLLIAIAMDYILNRIITTELVYSSDKATILKQKVYILIMMIIGINVVHAFQGGFNGLSRFYPPIWMLLVLIIGLILCIVKHPKLLNVKNAIIKYGFVTTVLVGVAISWFIHTSLRIESQTQIALDFYVKNKKYIPKCINIERIPPPLLSHSGDKLINDYIAQPIHFLYADTLKFVSKEDPNSDPELTVYVNLGYVKYYKPILFNDCKMCLPGSECLTLKAIRYDGVIRIEEFLHNMLID